LFCATIILAVSFFLRGINKHMLLSYLLIKGWQPICGFQWVGDCGPLWFLPAYSFGLLLLNIASSLKRWQRWMLAIIMFELVWLLRKSSFGLLPFGCSQAIGGFVFMLIGFEFKDETVKSFFLQKKILIPGLIFWLAASCFFVLSIAALSFPLNIFHFPISLFGTIAIFLLVSKSVKSSWLCFLGRNTLPILSIHSIDYNLNISNDIASLLTDDKILFLLTNTIVKVSIVFILFAIFSKIKITNRILNISY